MELMKSEGHSTNKSLKKMLEEEKEQVVKENEILTTANTALKGKVEECRKKLVGGC